MIRWRPAPDRLHERRNGPLPTRVTGLGAPARPRAAYGPFIAARSLPRRLLGILVVHGVVLSRLLQVVQRDMGSDLVLDCHGSDAARFVVSVRKAIFGAVLCVSLFLSS